MADFIAIIGNVRKIRCIHGAIPDFSVAESYEKQEHFPQTDVIIRGDIVHMYSDIPGVDPDDISIYVYDHFVVVEGIKSRKSFSDSACKYLRLERYFSTFRRIFKFPFKIMRYEAVIYDGVLHVALAAD